MNRDIRPAVFAFALLVPCGMGHAGPSGLPGELRCEVHGGLGLVLATNRAVDCIYRRDHMPVEFYSGYTGVITMSIGPTPERYVTFKVLSPDPLGLATLQGEFTGPLEGYAPGFNTLTGGAGASLVPAANGTAISHLHLNYAGVIHAKALQPGLSAQPRF
jgi:hypothetical protein